MDDSVILTTYQRGNRDGLLALASWADELAKVQRVDYEKMRHNIDKNNLSRASYEMTVTHSVIREEVYRSIANHARRMAESLPIDPEET